MVRREDLDSCVDDSTLDMSKVGMISLLHLAEFGDAAAIEELTRRKIEAELNKPDNA